MNIIAIWLVLVRTKPGLVVMCIIINYHSGYFAVTGYGIIFDILPSYFAAPLRLGVRTLDYKVRG